MTCRSLIIACALGLASFRAAASYNCYDYCNAFAVQMIENSYKITGYQLSLLDVSDVLLEVANANHALGMSTALANGLGGQKNLFEDDLVNSRLQSYAEIRRRLSLAKSERHMRQSYPAAKAAQSVNAKGEIVTADGVSKVGKDMAEVCKIPTADGYGQGEKPDGQAKGGNDAKPPAGGEQAGKGEDAKKEKDPINFTGSPAENAKSLFEVFNRLKLMTTGVQAIAYVNPMTSRNLGAQPNQIYTIYTQRPMGEVLREYTGWSHEEEGKTILQVEIGANNQTAGTHSTQTGENKPATTPQSSSTTASDKTANGTTAQQTAQTTPTPGANSTASTAPGQPNTQTPSPNTETRNTPATPYNPHEPLSVYQLWAQSPLIEPENIEQIFNRHSVDIEMFEIYKAYAEEQANLDEKTGIDSSIKPLPETPNQPTNLEKSQITDNNQTAPANDDTPKPPLQSAINKTAKPLTATTERIGLFKKTDCTWDSRVDTLSKIGHNKRTHPKHRGMSNMEIVKYYAQEMGYPQELLLAQVWQESNFKSGVSSHKGATGLVQFMPDTAGEKGKPWYHKDRTDPHQNVPAAIHYMRQHLKDRNNDIIRSLGRYNAGGLNDERRAKGYKTEMQIYTSWKEPRGYIEKIMCNTKLMMLTNNNPQIGDSTSFDFRTDMHLITALGFNASGSNFFLPMGSYTYFHQEDEYGMEKYGIFVENSNAYRNVDRTDMSHLFAWLSIQYNNDLTAEMLNKVFAHLNEPPAPGTPGDTSIEGHADTVKTDKQEKMGIGAETVKKDKDGKSRTVERGTGIHDSLVNNYAQYLSAYWFDPIVVPPQVYPDTEHMTTAQLNLFYAFVRKRLEMNGTPTRIGNDRVPLQVMKALIEGGNDAYAVAFAHLAATGRKMPYMDRYDNPYARNWVAEATIAEMNRGLVNSALVDHLEFRLRPDRSSWPSYNAMALHMGKNPDDLGKVISPTLALDMALYSAYNPVKHLISPEDALELKSYYSHGYYPFMRYYGDETTPVGEEPNRFTEQVVLDKTLNYLHDPKFMEFTEMAHGDDLVRQKPRYTGIEAYISFRRLKEARNRQRLLMAWAGSAVGNGFSTETGYEDGRPGFDQRTSNSGTAAFGQGQDKIK